MLMYTVSLETCQEHAQEIIWTLTGMSVCNILHIMSTPTLPPIARVSLRDHVYTRLQRAIVSGELAPGLRLRDQDLATQLGVSRTPVREALQRLEDEGLVETHPGALTRVVPLESEGARDAFPVVATLHALATRLAVARLAPADLAALRTANAALAAALTAADVASAIAADDQFHGVFVRVAGNRAIAPALDRLMPCVRRLEYAQFGSLAGRRSVEQHAAIIAASARGAVVRAAALVEENWLSLGQLIINAFTSQQQQES
jgi:DNA-binding GntR family transcriptional regulator